MAARTEPSVRVGVVIRPAVPKPDSAERPRRKVQSVTGISIGDATQGVITAPLVVVAISERIDIVPQRRQSHRVLQMMPGHTSHGETDNRVEDDNPQTVN